jgi:glycosyltransferase involved in cell wall biosynthesis
MPEGDTSTTPTVSVVIPTRDRRLSLERTLAALRAERDLHEVIVVDDGSKDDTAVWLAGAAAEWPAIRRVATSGVGSNWARAVGSEYATGDVILFLDDDVVPAPGVVAGHARHHLGAEPVVVSGYYPVVLERRSPATTRLAALSYENELGAVEADPALGLRQFWGGHFSMRRADLALVPLAVPEFEGPWRHGDREFGLRCRQSGFRFVFDRELRSQHFFERSLAQFRGDALRSGYGSVLVSRLHAGTLDDGSTALSSPRRVLSPLLRMTDWSPFYRLSTAMLDAVARLGDTLRVDRIGDTAVRLLLLIERRHGARKCLAGLPASVGGDNAGAALLAG